MVNQIELPWIAEARKYIGLYEKTTRGKRQITKWLENLGGGWLNHTAPWCGTFVANMAASSNRWIPKFWFRAKSFASNKMTKLDKPAYGCVVVFNRKGGGHVGFVIGVTENGDLCVLGGNQSDKVTIRAFARSRVIGYYWLSDKNGNKKYPYPSRYDLPILNADMTVKES